MTVTPQQVLETVGPQVVREIQDALDEARSAALNSDDAGPLVGEHQLVYGPVLPAPFDSAADDEALIRTLSEDGEEDSSSLDLAMEELFGHELDQFIGPRRPK